MNHTNSLLNPYTSLGPMGMHGGITKNIHLIIWKCRVPLKIKIFLRQLYNRKIQAGMVIKKRGWKGFGARERREKCVPYARVYEVRTPLRNWISDIYSFHIRIQQQVGYSNKSDIRIQIHNCLLSEYEYIHFVNQIEYEYSYLYIFKYGYE